MDVAPAWPVVWYRIAEQAVVELGDEPLDILNILDAGTRAVIGATTHPDKGRVMGLALIPPDRWDHDPSAAMGAAEESVRLSIAERLAE